MTRRQAIAILKRRQGDLTLRQFATALGISAAYLSDVYLGKRDIGPTILRSIGLTKTRTTKVTYQKAQ